MLKYVAREKKETKIAQYQVTFQMEKLVQTRKQMLINYRVETIKMRVVIHV